MTDGDGRRSPHEWLQWFWRTDHGAVVYVREVAQSVGAVLLVGLVLFAVSGIWPPMVAVESGSMEPHLQKGDLVFVMEEQRLVPDAAYGDTGVVTYRGAAENGYSKFGSSGDVVVYRPDGDNRTTPIIHRAMFWVNESENWYDKAYAVDAEAVGAAENCRELQYCPAPHGGFITKGDNDNTNRRYDQVSSLSPPVKPSWVVGTAELRIPWLGNIRLWATQGGVVTDYTVSATAAADPPVRGSHAADAVTPRAGTPDSGSPDANRSRSNATAANATPSGPTAASA